MEVNELRITDLGREWLNDLYRFCTEGLGLDLYETPHRQMCAVIEQQEKNPDTPYSMLVVPRGFYKTSIACGAAVWKQLRQLFLYHNPYHRIVLCSATLALSETSLRAIENMLRDNRTLKENYGSLWIYDSRRKLSSRHKDGLFLAPRLRIGEIAGVREPSFWIGSERRISTGFHADEAIVDDLNNDKNSWTPIQREKVHAYWELLSPILGHKDRAGNPVRIHINATPWHDDDVRGRILRKERERQETNPDYKSRWTILHHNAYADEAMTTAWWPEGCPVEFIEGQRADLSYSQFAANFLCDPIGQKGFVDEERIIWKPRAAFPEDPRDFRATVDPNMHFEARAIGCYAAITVSGYDKFSNLYFYDARGSREWGSSQLIAQLFQVQEDWKTHHPNIPILIEDIHMAHFAHAIALEEAQRSEKAGERVHLNIRWVNTQTESKYQKWAKLKPRFEQGRVILAEEIHPKIKVEIREELVRGESARFCDFLDSMAMAYIGVRPKIDHAERPKAPVRRFEPSISGPVGPTMAEIYPYLKTLR